MTLGKTNEAIAGIITKIVPAGASATLFKTSLIAILRRVVNPEVEQQLGLPKNMMNPTYSNNKDFQPISSTIAVHSNSNNNPITASTSSGGLESLTDTILLSTINALLNQLVQLAIDNNSNKNNSAAINNNYSEELQALKERWRKEREETAKRIAPLVQIVRTKLVADKKSSDALREVDRYLERIQMLSNQQLSFANNNNNNGNNASNSNLHNQILQQKQYNDHLAQVSRMVSHMRQMVQSKLAQDEETEENVIAICTPSAIRERPTTTTADNNNNNNNNNKEDFSSSPITSQALSFGETSHHHPPRQNPTTTGKFLSQQSNFRNNNNNSVRGAFCGTTSIVLPMTTAQQQQQQRQQQQRQNQNDTTSSSNKSDQFVDNDYYLRRQPF